MFNHRYRSLAALATLLSALLSACSERPEAPPATPAPSQDTGPTLTERARAIHQAALVLDAHADIEIPGSPSPYVGPDGKSRVSPAKMAAGGVDAVVMAAAVGPGPRTPEGYATARSTAETELAAVRALAEDPANYAVIPLSSQALVAAHEEGKLSLLLGVQNALIFGTNPGAVDELFAAGARVFALTHMGHNDFADSSRPLYLSEIGTHEPSAEHGGLSALGVAAIERVNALGGIVDVSQLSRQATLQAIDVSRAPIVASHSNVQALTDVSRNLSDEEIDRIGETGGVIHVAPFRGYLFDSSDEALDGQIRAARRAAGLEEDYFYPFELYWEIDDEEARTAFLSSVSELLGPGRLDDMLNHLDYIVQRIGIDHVGIGTDFNHGSEVEGFSDASEALSVTIALLERGYSEGDVKKIWGGNFIRVWREAERLAGSDD